MTEQKSKNRGSAHGEPARGMRGKETGGEPRRRSGRGGTNLRRRATQAGDAPYEPSAHVAPEDAGALLQELQRRQARLEMQNEELRRAQLELEKSRDRYTDLYEFAPVGYLTLDGVEHVREANHVAATLLGMERGELVGMHFSSLLLVQSLDTWRQHMRDVRASVVRQTCEVATQRGADGPGWLRLETTSKVLEGDRGPREYRMILVDVSERRHAEELLAKSEARHELALAAGDIGEWSWNMLSNAVYMSPRWKAQLGYEDHEVAQRYEEWMSRLHPDDHARVLAEVRAYRENPSGSYEAEYRLRHKDGGHRWFISRAAMRYDEHGRPVEMLGSHVDITARKQAEEALLELNHTLEQRVAERTAALESANTRLAMEVDERTKAAALVSALVDSASDAIVVTDAAGVIESANAATERMFGMPVRELIGEPLCELIPSMEFQARPSRRRRRAGGGAERGTGRHRQAMGKRSNGSLFPVELTLGEFRDATPRFTHIIRDVTERRNLQWALAEGMVEERREMARELHDGLAQRLTGAELIAHTLHVKLDRGEPVDADTVARLVAELHGATEQVRRFINGVYRHTVEADGLVRALEDLAEEIRGRRGPQCTFSVPGRRVARDATTATQLFYIAREAANNALRHARAKHLHFGLDARDGRLLLTVRDDGKGIEPGRVRSGMGTQIMEYRAGLIGATLDIQRLPRGGTLVTCTMPLARARSEQ